MRPSSHSGLVRRGAAAVVGLLLAGACGAGEVPCGTCFGEPELFDATDREAMALDLEGRYLYGGAGNSVLVFDLTDPLKPRKVGQVSGIRAARQLVVQKGICYVTTREYGVWIVDATDPTRPRIRSRFDCCELATGIDVAGDVCFCGQRQNGVEFIDVRDPDRPRHIAMRKTDESQSVVYCNGYLYSGEWQKARVTVFDARDMADIRQVAFADLNGYGDGVWRQGNHLYASRGHHAVTHAPGRTNKGHLDMKPGDAAYGAGHGLDVFEVSDPTRPKAVGSVDFPPFYKGGLDMWTPRTSGNLLVAAQTHDGLFAVDISDRVHPKVLDRRVWPSDRFTDVPSDCVGSAAIGDGAVYAAVKGRGFYVVPCASARIEVRERGVLPKNAQVREPYPADEAAWHVWKPRDVGQVRGVAVRGDVAYAACGDAGLYALDILPDGGGWRERGKVGGRDRVYDVSVCGDRLFTAEGLDGFGVYDISGAMPREIARLPQLATDRPLAFWVIAANETRLLCSDRRRWTIVDISRLRAFQPLGTGASGGPGWNKYMIDRPIGGRFLAFNDCHRRVLWYDVTTGRQTAETKRNNTTLMNGIGAFGPDRAVFSKKGGFALIGPEEGDAADGSPWPLTVLPQVGGKRMNPGIPRSDGRLVAFTCRINRQALLYDFADPRHPVAKGAWTFSGNPDVAAFHRGKVIVPCGYEGLLLQR